MTLPRLYDDLAWLWPHLSPPEHYQAEAALLESLIAKHLGPGPKRILELGAGGGHTLVHLAKQTGGTHDCVAADLSEPMLANCRNLIPGIETHVGDMRDVRLEQKFDVVLIHDAVDYLLSEEDVSKTLATAHAHLRTGGLAFIAPTYTRENFVDGDVANDGTPGSPPGSTPGSEHAQGGEVSEGFAGASGLPGVTYFSYVHDPDPADDTFEMILLYLLRPRKGAGVNRDVEVIEDRHTCGLFGNATWLRLMSEAGLPAELVEQEGGGAWSLFLGWRAKSEK